MLKTVAELAEEGRRTVEEREDKRRQAEEADRRAKLLDWQAFRVIARRHLGAVCPELPGQPPDWFSPCQDNYIHARPFGAALLSARFERRDGTWAQTRFSEMRGASPGLYRVVTAYEVGRGEEGWEVTWAGHACVEQTDNLAEAVFLCQQATDSYRRAEAEAAAKNADPAERERVPF